MRADVLAPSGLIPACAGSMTESTRFYWKGAAHPRVRGEHAPTSTLRFRAFGSSPRARGAFAQATAAAAGGGLIPACAESM